MIQALKHAKPPTWSGEKHTFATFWYDMTAYLTLMELWGTVCGSDVAAKASTAEEERLAYRQRSMLAFRVLLTAISDAKPEGQALKLQIRDEFGDDMDGHELAEYLKAYAQEVTNTDVKLMRERLDSMSFKATQSAAEWNFKMQSMRMLWTRIPEARRGGDDEALRGDC